MVTSQFPDGLHGADFYHGNNVTDFHAIADAGLTFCFLKSSEGTGFADPAYQGYRQRAVEAGLLYGAYHFFTADDPLQQARFFMDTAAPASGELIPVLDVETQFDGVGAAALDCATEIKAICGHFPIIYCNDSFWQGSLKGILPDEATLWIARYGYEPVTPCAVWQFSRNGNLPGVDGNVDLDVFNGTIGDLQGLVMAGKAAEVLDRD